MRDFNRARLVEVLGEEEFERVKAAGRGLALDRRVVERVRALE